MVDEEEVNSERYLKGGGGLLRNLSKSILK